MLLAYGKHAAMDECLLMTSCFARQFCLQVDLGSTCQLTSIFGHVWPTRVPVSLNFEVRFNYSSAFSWLIKEGVIECRNDLSCFSFSFQHRIRQENERKVSTDSYQFSFKENKRRQSVTSCNKFVLQQKSWR